MKFKIVIDLIDLVTEKIGYIVSWVTTILVLAVFYDTILRYVFNNGSIKIQELQWHIFSIIFLVGAAYTLKKDGHVRVDILYTKFSFKTKAWIDFIGVFIFLIPFSLVVIYSTNDFIYNSWIVRETSADPGGLPCRYILKAVIPIGFILVLLQGLAQAFKNFMVIIGKEEEVRK